MIVLFIMVGVAQLVRALVCGTSCRGFESHHPPTFFARVAELVDALVLGTSTYGVRVRVSPLVNEYYGIIYIFPESTINLK